MSHDDAERDVAVTANPAALEAIRRLGAARGRLADTAVTPARSRAPHPDAVLDVALEALRFEHAHAEASRSRAAGLLTACGVLLALTAGLGSAAAQAAQKLSHLGAGVTVCAAALTAVLLLAAAAISGQVFAPSRKSRMALEELREFAELRFRAADKELLSKAALERLAAARDANLISRARSTRAMALYVGALGVLGAQVLLIAIVHLLGV
jgi:transcriptional regulator with AAA-type ATPase domain